MRRRSCRVLVVLVALLALAAVPGCRQGGGPLVSRTVGRFLPRFAPRVATPRVVGGAVRGVVKLRPGTSAAAGPVRSAGAAHVPFPAVRVSMLADLPGGRQTLERLGPGLEKMEAHIHQLAWRQVAEASRGLLKDPAIPAELRVPLQEVERRAVRLHGWQQLRLLVGRPWQTPPDPVAVKAWLAEAEESAGRPTADRVGRYLACRAHLEGHEPLARSLQPTRDTGALLRDLKVVGQDRPPAPPTDHATESTLGPMLPEGPALSLRPAVREALGADLPAIAPAETQARAETLREIESAARQEWHHAAVQLARLAPYRNLPSRPAAPRPAVQPPTTDALTAEVAEGLGRDLSPAEAVLARHLGRTHKPAEVAALLRAAAHPVDKR